MDNDDVKFITWFLTLMERKHTWILEFFMQSGFKYVVSELAEGSAVVKNVKDISNRNGKQSVPNNMNNAIACNCIRNSNCYMIYCGLLQNT